MPPALWRGPGLAPLGCDTRCAAPRASLVRVHPGCRPRRAVLRALPVTGASRDASRPMLQSRSRSFGCISGCHSSCAAVRASAHSRSVPGCHPSCAAVEAPPYLGCAPHATASRCRSGRSSRYVPGASPAALRAEPRSSHVRLRATRAVLRPGSRSFPTHLRGSPRRAQLPDRRITPSNTPGGAQDASRRTLASQRRWGSSSPRMRHTARVSGG